MTQAAEKAAANGLLQSTTRDCDDSTALVTDADLIGSLCAAPRSVAAPVGAHLRATDCTTIGGQRALDVVLDLLAAGKPHGFESVQLELLRRGAVDGPAKSTMLSAATSGRFGLETELRTLAESMVTTSFRAFISTWGTAMTNAADSMALVDLLPSAVAQGRAAREHADRLGALQMAVIA